MKTQIRNSNYTEAENKLWRKPSDSDSDDNLDIKNVFNNKLKTNCKEFFITNKGGCGGGGNLRSWPSKNLIGFWWIGPRLNFL